ncbi:MAG TPA: hypothetical protein VFF28_07015 [Candidatus Nanoarchaeia archaeon]|nr:hypothetical protein [Candidatus Nanoarchaeia archaeon]
MADKQKIAVILALLAIIPWVGYLFGLAAIILGIDCLIKEKKKGLAIAALVISIIIISVKISIAITGLLSGFLQPIAEFSQLDYEQALNKCQSQEGDLQSVCYAGLVLLHINDTRVESGDACINITADKTRVECLAFTAIMTNNTDLCLRIEAYDMQETTDAKNYCIAMVTNDELYCSYISDYSQKLSCIQGLKKDQIRNIFGVD